MISSGEAASSWVLRSSTSGGERTGTATAADVAAVVAEQLAPCHLTAWLSTLFEATEEALLQYPRE